MFQVYRSIKFILSFSLLVSTSQSALNSQSQSESISPKVSGSVSCESIMDSESRCALALLKNDSPSVSQKVIPTTFQGFVVTGDSDTSHVGYSKLPRPCRILELTYRSNHTLRKLCRISQITLRFDTCHTKI